MKDIWFRLIVVIGIFLVSNVCVTGQIEQARSVSFKWSREYSAPSNTFLSRVIHWTDDGFYALRQKGEGSFSNDQKFYIEKYNSELKLEKAKELTLKYKGKRRKFEDLLVLDNEFYVLTSFHNTGHNKNYLFVQHIVKDRLTLSKRIEKIAEIDTYGPQKSGEYSMHVSSDSSRVLVFTEEPYKKNKNERLAFTVFNSNLEKVWGKDTRMSITDEELSIQEYKVDNNGNVYLLGILFQDKAREKRKGKPNYKYSIHTYAEKGEEKEVYNIELGDKFITDLTFRIANDGTLVFAGFYSDKGTYSIKGTCFFRLDPKTKEIFNKNFKPFDFEFLTQFYTPKKKEKAQKAKEEGNVKKQPELYQYSLDHLILRSDGGAVLIAEQYFIEERSWNDYYYNRYYYDRRYVDYYFNYNDIIVVNIRPNGEIEWSARIPKRQVTLNDGGYFSSYAMATVRDKFVFIYNDNSRNYDAESRKDRIYSFNGNDSNSVIALSEVHKDGKVYHFPLFPNREARIIARPKSCKQVGRREMLLYGERGKKYRFAKLSF